jgi:hypothetical protein
VSITAITTCHAAGWTAYGERMAESWVAHWPVDLIVYAEGFDTTNPRHGQLDLTDIRWLTAFKEKHPYKRPGAYNYRFDAPRFAHKVAAICDAADRFRPVSQWLVWADADTVTHTDVPQSAIDEWLPRGNEALSWLDRDNKYPECGFMIFNLRHPQVMGMLTKFRKLYTTGEVFKLAEWHDSFVLQHLVEKVYRLKTRSLSGLAGRRTSHPFVNGPLGAYMDHMKGPRKEAGKSYARDLKVERSEDYWSKA